jgi:hypothetical protein
MVHLAFITDKNEQVNANVEPKDISMVFISMCIESAFNGFLIEKVVQFNLN